VSLSTLYAGALFVVGRIPLDDIFLMATPLHSQNFIVVNDGIITNNRRIVTKNMWFNGTEISEKSRRALKNERVTVVSHNTGYIHTLYPTATIAPSAYAAFIEKLHAYLSTELTFEILANFLRQNSSYQKCFQVAHTCYGKNRYIEAEKVYSYEHSSTFKISDENRARILHEIDEDEFYPTPIHNRLILDEIEKVFKQAGPPLSPDAMIEKLKEHLNHQCFNVDMVMQELLEFCSITPRLPDTGKNWDASQEIHLNIGMSREDIISYLESIRSTNTVADLAFAAYRDMSRTPWKPFIKAAMERNPVSCKGAEGLTIDAAAAKLAAFDNASIYDGQRMAQPDEVWNYNRGDGLEKALCLMNIIKNRHPQSRVTLTGDYVRVTVQYEGTKEYTFFSTKNLKLPLESDFEF
jgi:hypothetical protein